ncbi:hypothetical protein ONZ45_g10056 [Pleurotus djamor]|nr:hypothetical protein ONZ45_g10056 [Pleurotus djamor]
MLVLMEMEVEMEEEAEEEAEEEVQTEGYVLGLINVKQVFQGDSSITQLSSLLPVALTFRTFATMLTLALKP